MKQTVHSGHLLLQRPRRAGKGGEVPGASGKAVPCRPPNHFSRDDVILVEAVFLRYGPGRNKEVMEELRGTRIAQKNAGTHGSRGTFEPSDALVVYVCDVMLAVIRAAVMHMGTTSRAVLEEKLAVESALDEICAALKLQRIQQSGVNEDKNNACGGAKERAVRLKGAKQPKIVAVPAPWVLEHIKPILEVRAAVELVRPLWMHCKGITFCGVCTK